MSYLRALLIGVALSAATTSAMAEETKPDCPIAANLPANLKAWNNAGEGAAAADAASLPSAPLSFTKSLAATLLPQARVHFMVTPSKSPDPVLHGGMFQLTIDEAGTYGIAASAGVWIDVVKDGVALTSTSHERAPECSGVHKIVYFTLDKGVFGVQIVNSRDGAVQVMAVKPE